MRSDARNVFMQEQLANRRAAAEPPATALMTPAAAVAVVRQDGARLVSAEGSVLGAWIARGALITATKVI
jgi:hypothetical protein